MLFANLCCINDLLTPTFASIKSKLLWGIVPLVVIELLLKTGKELNTNIMSGYLILVTIVSLVFMGITFKKYMLDK